MGATLDSFKAKAFSVAESFLGPIQKAKQDVAPLNAPVFKEIPPEMKGNQYIIEGMKGWAYAAISAIADDVSSNPCLLYKRKGKDWTPIDFHPFLDLLNKPNPYQTKEEVFWLTIGYMLTVGECLWVLDNSINPKELIVFNPTKTRVIYSDKNMIGSYELTLSDGSRQMVPAENVIFFKLPSFNTPFRGTGVMEHIAATVDIDNFAQDYIKVFFYNSALPNAVLQTESEIPEDIGRRLIKQFEARHKGLKKSHKLALLDRGLKFTSIDKSFTDMQMGEMETKIRDRILAAFRVPKSVLGIIDEVNRANAEASDRNFSKRAVMPKLKFLQAQINQYLVTKFADGMNLWFEFENPVPEDELMKAQIRQINILSKVRTANEYREEDGLEPIEDEEEEIDPTDEEALQEETKMKKLLRERTNIRISRAKFLTLGQKKVFGTDLQIYETAEKIVRAQEKARKAHRRKALGKEINKGPYSETKVAEYHTKKIENNDVIEKQFSERVWINQKRQKRAILDQITGKRRKKTSLEIKFDEEEEASILTALSTPYYERTILAQAALTAALLNIDNTLDTQDNRVKAYMRKWTGKLGKSNAETVNDFIKKTLREWGENEKATIADLKKTFTEYFDDKAKADLISRTEVSRAAGFSTETVYKDAGVIGKRWIAAVDERTCEFCSQLDGKIVELGENFVDAGDTLVGRDGGKLKADYGGIPAEPSHPNCRCDILPVFEFEKGSPDFSFKAMQREMIKIDNDKKILEQKKKELEKEKQEHDKKVEEDIAALEQVKSMIHEQEAGSTS